MNKAFAITDSVTPSEVAALIMTNDADGPRDQAWLYAWVGEDHVNLVAVPEGWSDPDIEVYLSLSQFAEEVFNLKIIKD